MVAMGDGFRDGIGKGWASDGAWDRAWGWHGRSWEFPR